MMEALYSGFEVCRRIRQNPELQNIPIFGISGMKDELGLQFDSKQDAEYFSPDVFFDKPVDKSALLNAINELLAGSARKPEYFMNFFEHSWLMNEHQLVINNFRFFFKIQFVAGCLWIFHHLNFEKIHPSGESP